MHSHPIPDINGVLETLNEPIQMYLDHQTYPRLVMPITEYPVRLLLKSTAFLLIAQVGLASASAPGCINNAITLPGQNGPEVWSCIGTGQAILPDSKQQLAKEHTANNDALSTDADTGTVSVEKRTDASSSAMKNEIIRVMEQTRQGDQNSIPKQVSIGIQYGANRRDKGLRDNRGRAFAIPVGMRLQLTDNTSVSATVPLLHKERESVSSSGVYKTDVAGIGDISLNATTVLLNETSTRPSVSLSVGVGAPTGEIEDPQTSDKISLGSGFWTTSLGATLSKRFDPATVFASTRYQHVFADKQFGYEVQPGSSLEYSYGLGFSLNSALSVSGHIAGSIHRNATVDGDVIAGSNSEPIEFASTSSLRFGKSTSLESNVAFGLNSDAEDVKFGLTLIKAF